MAKDLDYYLGELRAMRLDRSSGYPKPHKVCLLLAVMDLIADNSITENRIYFDDQLKSHFSRWFQKYKSGNDTDDPSQPYFYLESSGFWHHKPNPEQQEEHRKRIKDRKHGSPGIVERIIDYAYLDQELFEYMRRDVARTAIENALLSNLDDMESRFQKWAASIGKSDKTIRNYVGAINGSITNSIREEGIMENSLFDITSYTDFNSLAGQYRNTKGKGVYNAALKLYGEFLADITQFEAGEDIQNINTDPTLDETEKSLLVNTRIGQGQFRQNLIKYWGCCAVTTYRDTRLLIASHIKPWRAADNRERLDKYNGVLLLPNLDKVFDLGFITFNENGKIMISNELEEFASIGVSEAMNIQMERHHKDYMAYHRQVVFKN